MLSSPSLRTHITTLVVATLSLLVFASSAAHAQQPPPPPAPTDSQPADEESQQPEAPDEASDEQPPVPPPAPDDLAPAEEAEQDSSDQSRADWYTEEQKPTQEPAGKRVALESLGGLGGMAGGYLVGGFTGGVVGLLATQDPFGMIIGIVAGAGIGLITGTPFGVYGVGKAMGGNGSYWAALGGTTLGLIGAGLLGGAVGNTGAYPFVATVSSVTLPIAGGVIGYELSNTAPSHAQRGYKGLQWNAGIGPTNKGSGAFLSIGARW